jgi:parallel beta-helix repeat protein
MGIRVSVVSSVFESFSAYNGNDGIWIESGHVRDCYVSANEGNGIIARVESTIIDCDARLNTLNGIRVSIDTTVRGNHCSQNGETVQKSGILVLGTGNRIDGNTVYSNGAYGIRVEDFGNTIHRNAAILNGNDYWFVTGNDVGPIGPSSTATSPWANISF